MTKYEFMWDIWERGLFPGAELLTEEEGDKFVNGLEVVPEGLESWEFTAFINDRILSENECVKDPITKRFLPRWTYMDMEQIAYVIREARTWGDVEDLVEYVLDNFIVDEWFEDIDPYAVEKRQEAVLRWCEERIA